jgi:hypothetical protein
MSIILYALGALCVMAGTALAAFGVPVSEFSFGNTLILAGAITAVGGLIVIGLGAVVSKLQQIVEAGHGPAPVQMHRPIETFESAPARPAAGRIPFPPKPKAEPKPAARPELKPEYQPESGREPLPAVIAPVTALPQDEPAGQTLAPTLPNPDESPVTVSEDVSLSPQQSGGVSHETAEFGERRDDRAPEPRDKPFEIDWGPADKAPAAEKRGSFAFMWPERKAEKAPPAKEEQPGAQDVAPAASEPPPSLEPALAVEAPMPAEEPRNVAVLKSGVVDGMGYTLYVDGSIEAELPQGTLRFASINELREHLEQNT